MGGAGGATGCKDIVPLADCWATTVCCTKMGVCVTRTGGAEMMSEG